MLPLNGQYLHTARNFNTRYQLIRQHCVVVTKLLSPPGGGAIFLPARKRTFSSSAPLAWYSRKLDSHPIVTKSISAAFIGGLGDVMSQFIESRKHNQLFQWDILRTSRFGCLGLVLVGPLVHHWYGAIMRWFPGQGVSAVAKRVAIDQLFFAPSFLPAFLSGLWVLEGKDTDKLLPALQCQVPRAMVVNWSLWVPAQIINFRFVPVKYQVLFSNFVGFIWNCYLSYTAHEH